MHKFIPFRSAHSCLTRCCVLSIRHLIFSTRCIRRTNHRAIAMMFVRLSVRPSGTGMHCDHTVHVSLDLSLQLDSLMFWAPLHQSMFTYSQPSFSSFSWNRGGAMDVQTRLRHKHYIDK